MLSRSRTRDAAAMVLVVIEVREVTLLALVDSGLARLVDNEGVTFIGPACSIALGACFAAGGGEAWGAAGPLVEPPGR